MTMSKVEEDEGPDRYEPIKRLAMVQLQPPRNPNKPFTSFCIKDILGNSSLECDRSNQNQHHHNEFTDYHSSQSRHRTRGLRQGDICEGGKIHNHLSKNIKSHNITTNGRHLHGGLLNMCKFDKETDGMRWTLSHRSTPTNGRHKSDVSVLTPPGCFPHGELLQVSSQSDPVNLTTKIVRPWDSDPGIQSTSIHTRTCSTTPGAILTASEASSDEDEEITVDDDDPPERSLSSNFSSKTKTVYPLDALMAMTSKTFEGLEGACLADVRRREQTTLFGKHQPPKKRRKSRTAFTNQQIYELEKRFLYQKYLTPADRDEIASSLGLSNAQVITWFQNRRAKLKRDLEELKNDVTAAKKLPFQKTITGSLAEIELRKVQEKTLRDSFNNGGLQSPSSSSLASLSDETHDTSSTPVHSPDHGIDDEEEIIPDRNEEEREDAKFFDDYKSTENNLEGDTRNLITDNERFTRKSSSPRGLGEHIVDSKSYDHNNPDKYKTNFVQERQGERCSDVAV